MLRKAALSVFCVAALLSAQSDHKATKADVDRWMTELSNWGRWGKDDQRGALNLITPEKRKQAIALVKEGYPVSLAHNVLTEKAVDNANPFVHTMLPGGGVFRMDSYSVSYHGLAHTHFDALCHANYDGKIYNGFPVDEVGAEGCPKDSILVAKTGVMTRGVLMDIAKLKGVDYMEPGTPIYPEDLEAWEKQAGVKVSAGDAVFIRTGRWAMRVQKGPSRTYAGLHASCAKWLHDRGVAILGSDAAQDVSPSQVEGVGLPIHALALVAMGIHLFDNCDLEDLGKEAAKRKRWVFLVTVAPMAIPGGTGSPINPIATY
jgi:kynurenine formamidase